MEILTVVHLVLHIFAVFPGPAVFSEAIASAARYHVKAEFHQALLESIFWKQVKYLLFVGPRKTN
jgi:hypothetical protein